MEQAGDVPDESLLELAGCAVGHRDKVKAFDHLHTLQKRQLLHMLGEFMRSDGVFSQIFALREDLIDPAILDMPLN